MNERSEITPVSTEENLLRDKASSNGRMPVAAVPSDGMHAPYDGITKRELFAAMAMQALAPQFVNGGDFMEKHVAVGAVTLADALLKELAK